MCAIAISIVLILIYSYLRRTGEICTHICISLEVRVPHALYYRDPRVYKHVYYSIACYRIINMLIHTWIPSITHGEHEPQGICICVWGYKTD